MKLKHVIGLAGAAAFLAAWTAVAIAFVLRVDPRTWTILVVVAAFASEALVWCLAAMLGLSVFEARRSLWRVLTSPFRRGDAIQPNRMEHGE
jgi:hypothetical protein